MAENRDVYEVLKEYAASDEVKLIADKTKRRLLF